MKSEVPFREEDPCVAPVSPYAATKRAGELLCRTFHAIGGNPVTCLRFFTVYGPSQRPEMAIHKFTRLIYEGKKVPVFGDGQSSRDYTWIDDIVDGIVSAMEKASGFRIYNLGGSRTTRLVDLVEMIGDAMGKAPSIEFQPQRKGDVPITYADITLSQADLGFNPKVSIKEGIPMFVEWFLSRRKERN